MKYRITNIFSGFLLALLCSLILFYFIQKNLLADIKNYIKALKELEQSIVQSTPIFLDYNKTPVSSELRKHLNYDHIAVTRKYPPVENQQNIDKLNALGDLIYLKGGAEEKYYFYNVPKTNRYVRKEAMPGLYILTTRLQQKIDALFYGATLKIAITSAIRPADYQKELTRVNFNAVNESTHSSGMSLDIFVDDFYLNIEPNTNHFLSKRVIDLIRPALGYYLGDALSRQLHTILSQSLIELQRENILYIIYEERQRCFHITFL